jgi:hypothetical protein
VFKQPRMMMDFDCMLPSSQAGSALSIPYPNLLRRHCSSSCRHKIQLLDACMYGQLSAAALLAQQPRVGLAAKSHSILGLQKGHPCSFLQDTTSLCKLFTHTKDTTDQYTVQCFAEYCNSTEHCSPTTPTFLKHNTRTAPCCHPINR